MCNNLLEFGELGIYLSKSCCSILVALVRPAMDNVKAFRCFLYRTIHCGFELRQDVTTILFHTCIRLSVKRLVPLQRVESVVDRL